MRQPHYPPVSGLCRRWLPTIRIQQGFTTGEMGFRVSLHSSNPEPLMSALGQKRTWRDQIAMSALPPKADIRWHDLNVRFVRRSTDLFDHFIGSHQQGRWNRKAESLRGSKVDDRFKVDRCLHRKIGRHSALQNTIHIGR